MPMSKEQALKQIEAGVDAFKKALIENIEATWAETVARLRNERSRNDLCIARNTLSELEQQLKEELDRHVTEKI